MPEHLYSPGASPAPPTRRFGGWPHAAVVAVLAACLLAVAGVAYGVTTSLSRTAAPSTAAPAVASGSAPSASGAGAGGGTGSGTSAHHHQRVRGTVTAISGNAWTVRSKHGTVAVTITSTTRFGTKKAPATRSRFAVGDTVVVVAAKGATPGATTTATPTAVTAARVATPHKAAHKPASGSATTSTAPTS